MITLFFFLLFGHALGDYPLQGEFLATGKNPKSTIPGFDWWVLLSMHSLIHGGIVGILTGSALLGALETTAHFAIDYGKSMGAFGSRIDQALHAACKLVWVALIAAGVVSTSGILL